jgi:NADPH:quinone reductase-like Zn-dependent oxidoreductase
MKAIVIDDCGGVDQLHLRELPDPRPHADEVLVRVRAAGVNPVDWKIRQGQLRFILRPRFPFVLGATLLAKSSRPGLKPLGSKPAIPWSVLWK